MADSAVQLGMRKSSKARYRVDCPLLFPQRQTKLLGSKTEQKIEVLPQGLERIPRLEVDLHTPPKREPGHFHEASLSFLGQSDPPESLLLTLAPSSIPGSYVHSDLQDQFPRPFAEHALLLAPNSALCL